MRASARLLAVALAGRPILSLSLFYPFLGGITMFAPNQSAAAPAAGKGNNNFEPAISFLNLYLPSKGGARVKLGAVPIKASREREKALHDALVADPELTKRIVELLEIEFQVVATGEANHFAL